MDFVCGGSNSSGGSVSSSSIFPVIFVDIQNLYAGILIELGSLIS